MKLESDDNSEDNDLEDDVDSETEKGVYYCNDLEDDDDQTKYYEAPQSGKHDNNRII